MRSSAVLLASTLFVFLASASCGSDDEQGDNGSGGTAATSGGARASGGSSATSGGSSASGGNGIAGASGAAAAGVEDGGEGGVGGASNVEGGSGGQPEAMGGVSGMLGAGAAPELAGAGGASGGAGNSGGSDAGSAGTAGADGGGGASGGAAGGAGGEANGCTDRIENPGCADANADTIDFESAVYGGCAHFADLGPNRGWVQYGSEATGFAVDVETGLGWLVRTTDGLMNRAEAAAFCESLSVHGLADWRLPTIDEARSLAAGCEDTAPGGSCPLADPVCLAASCGFSSGECESCKAHSGPHGGSGDFCRAEVTICLTMHTSSSCADCGTPGEWAYGVINGNFYSASGDARNFFPVCVMSAIPRGVPCLD